MNILIACIPARPSCNLIPFMVMETAQAPADPGALDPIPLRAACAVAGWCAEGWILADMRLVREAAHTLTAALQNYCTPWSHMHAHVKKFDPLAVVSGNSEGGSTTACLPCRTKTVSLDCTLMCMLRS
jgi:hypothetical protein